MQSSQQPTSPQTTTNTAAKLPPQMLDAGTEVQSTESRPVVPPKPNHLKGTPPEVSSFISPAMPINPKIESPMISACFLRSESPLLLPQNHHKFNQPNTQPKPLLRDNSLQYEPIGRTKRTFRDIVANNSALPVKVVVRESIYGLCETFSIAENDFLDFHFMKETRSADVLTSKDEKFKIPLYAPYTFTFNHSSNHSLWDIDYKTSELFKLGYLPKIGIVKDGFQQNKKKSSKFVQGEVLILPNRIESSTIECFSLSHKETKRIHKSSELTLTTNPSRMTFDFADLTFFDFPLDIQIHVTPERSSLQSTFESTSTIIGLTKIETIIASNSRAHVIFEPDEMQTIDLFEFLCDAPIHFELTHTLPQEEDKLIRKTTMIYENFNPVYVKKVLYSTDHNSRVQGKLYESMINPYPGKGDERWKIVTKIYRPKHLYRSPSIGLYKTTSVPDLMQRFVIDHDGVVCRHDPLSQDPKNRHSTFNFTIDGPRPSPIINDTNDINVTRTTRLTDLSCDQVLLLLEKLRLSRYKEAFAKEQISGDLLAELDEEILECELGITSKLHRIKLLRVIEGRASVDSVLNCGTL